MHEDQSRRILVGVHGSAASAAALRWAAREAGLLSAWLHVVQALECQASSVAPYAPHGHRLARQDAPERVAAQLQHEVRDTLGSPPLVTVRSELAKGLAARVLLDYAAGAEFLVLGSSCPAADCIGPVARACLARAPCPVVIVSATVTQVLAIS